MKVILNSGGYSYDVHSLVKAFYPYEDVKVNVTTEYENADSSGISVFVSSGDVSKSDIVSGYIRCEVREDDRVLVKDREYTNADRPGVKSILKKVLYELLSEHLGKSLPWGTLTGIRPTKIPMGMLNEQNSREDIRKYMSEEYLCSDEKITLSTDIAEREIGIINSLSENGFSMYVGIPFCPTTCMYCSFTSYPIVSWKSKTDEYLKALKREIDFFADYYKGRRPDSIYIGGGTPTTLEAGQLTELTDYIAGKFDLSVLKEFTVEAGRPDSITEDKLKALFDARVTRISINPQTMNEETLRTIGRSHTIEDVYTAFKLARNVGFDNINADLILGLPGETDREVAYTFDRIKELAPESITVHSMAIKRAAKMSEYLEKKGIKSIITPNMLEMAQNAAADMNMKPYYMYRQKNMTGNYENVGYSQEGRYGIYNIVIMEEISDIAACGAGTISKRIFDNNRIERCDNVKDVGLYISQIDEMIERKRKLFCC